MVICSTGTLYRAHSRVLVFSESEVFGTDNGEIISSSVGVGVGEMKVFLLGGLSICVFIE